MNIEHFWRGLRMSYLSSERGKLATAVSPFEAEGWALINLGSVASDFAFPLQGMYSTTKHAIKVFTVFNSQNHRQNQSQQVGAFAGCSSLYSIGRS